MAYGRQGGSRAQGPWNTHKPLTEAWSLQGVVVLVGGDVGVVDRLGRCSGRCSGLWKAKRLTCTGPVERSQAVVGDVVVALRRGPGSERRVRCSETWSL